MFIQEAFDFFAKKNNHKKKIHIIFIFEALVIIHVIMSHIHNHYEQTTV